MAPKAQPPSNQSGEPSLPAFPLRGLGWKNKAFNIAIIAIIAGCIGTVVTILVPKPAFEGRLVAELGDVRVFALSISPFEEELAVWRGRGRLSALPADPNLPVQQFDMSSNNINASGTHHADIVVDGWSGGSHCCLTRLVFDGPTGKLLGRLNLGGSGASRFVKLDRTGPYPSAFLAYDDLTLDGQNIEQGQPLAQVVLILKDGRFGLYQEAMKATTPESPPPYLLREVFTQAQLEIDAATENHASGPRGDLAQELAQAALARRTAMASVVLDPDRPESFAPVAAFLNEYVYKGQAEAGFEAVRRALSAQEKALNPALSSYADQLSRSQWIEDLDRLNDSRLKPLIDGL